MKNLFVIVGPTAVGKTKVAIEIAKKFNTEIISADSRQIYKEMNIGTARPTEEELANVKHHFIACKSIENYYNASMYEIDALQLIDELFRSYNNIVVVGGSGLYIDALLYGIDDLPTIDKEIRQNLQDIFENQGIQTLRNMLERLDKESFCKIDLNNPKRILKCLEITIQTGKPYSSFLTGNRKKRDFNYKIFFINQSRQILYNKIDFRVEKMVEEGLIEEAASLIDKKHLTPLQTIGYREIFEYFENKSTLKEAVEKIKFNTHNYARKQISWFKRYKEAILIDDDFSNFDNKILQNI